MTDAVVLFSGGLDSTVLLAHALDEGLDIRVLEFDYPGRPAGERAAAQAILDHYAIAEPIQLQMPAIDADDTTPRPDRPTGYVPLRNLWFHTTAALVARQVDAACVLVGHLDQDALDFPDARPDYLQRIQTLVNDVRLADEPEIRLERPFEGRSKIYVARQGRRLGAPLDTTWSCYQAEADACGECTGCKERNTVLEATA